MSELDSKGGSLDPNQSSRPGSSAPPDTTKAEPKGEAKPATSVKGQAAKAAAKAAGVPAPVIEGLGALKGSRDAKKTQSAQRPTPGAPNVAPTAQGGQPSQPGKIEKASNAASTGVKVGRALKVLGAGSGGAGTAAAASGTAAAGAGTAAAAGATATAAGTAAAGAATAAAGTAAAAGGTAAAGAAAASAPVWVPIVAVAVVVIVLVLVLALIMGLMVLSGANENQMIANAETVSVEAVIADGIPGKNLSQYIDVADSAGIPWQFIPAIKYVHENKDNLVASSTTLGDDLRFMTWNVCQNACKEDWRERAEGWVEKIKYQQPDVLALQEAGFSEGPNVGKIITGGTGLAVAGKAIEGQHIYYNKSRLRLMETNRIELQQPYGARWARFRKPDDTQFIAVSLHLVNNKGAEWDSRRASEMAEIYEKVIENNPDDLPVVFMGDFNSNQSRDTDAPYDLLFSHGYRNSLGLTLTEAVNKEYNSGWGGEARPPMKAAKQGSGKTGYNVDQIMVSGGTTVNAWEQMLASDVDSDGRYKNPFITDHNAIIADLVLPEAQGAAGVEVYDGDGEDLLNSGLGPFRLDVKETRKHKGYEKFNEDAAEDELTSASVVATLLARESMKINENIDEYALTAGAEYDESGTTSILADTKADPDNSAAAELLQETYTAALAELPMNDAQTVAPMIYQIARGWALGLQACVMNTSTGAVAPDGTWSNPMKGPVSDRSFKMRVHPVTGVYKLHEGADMAVPAGTKVVAAGSGKVVHAGGGGTRSGWAGIYVEIDHGNDIHTIYAHMQSAALKTGQLVSAGMKVGEVGSTGMSTGAHLHFQVERKAKPINPMEFLKERGITLGKTPPVSDPGPSAPGGGMTIPATDTDTEAGDGAATGPAAGVVPQKLTSRTTSGKKVSLNEKQLKNAAAIVAVGQQMQLPENALIIAIMTAMQESKLLMYANRNNPESLSFPHQAVGQDHDSLGLFQQRPAAGWGTTAELMDAEYNAKAFFGGPNGPNKGTPAGLLDNRSWGSMPKGSWESLPLGVAAQRVQVSAHPTLYDQWEPVARDVVAAVAGINPNAGTSCSATIDETTGAGVVADNATAKKALEVALAQVGVPYVWGGTTPSGFDCSGLTQYAYGKAGITLPRLSYDQDRVGIKIKESDLSPGDLVYWKDSWHVAMYVGDGKVVHAPRPGKNVEVVPLAQAHSGKPYGYSRPWAGTESSA